MNIDTKGMQIATLTSAQLNDLKEYETKLNGGNPNQGIYLVAVRKNS